MPNDTVYIGVDPGLTVTTIIALQNGQVLPDFPEAIKYANDTILNRLMSYRYDMRAMIYETARYSRVVACIEKPPYTLKGDSVNLIPLYWYLLEGIYLGFHAAMLTDMDKPASLFDHSIYIVAPTSLKKFATGKGTGKKSTIGQSIERRWGDILPEELFTPDEADAFVLAKMAECIDNPDGDEWTKSQIETIQKVEKYE